MTKKRKRKPWSEGLMPRNRLRACAESARLDLRALYRALDRLHLAREIPEELQPLLELDADLAEALWVLDQPRGRFDRAAMTRDTLASLEEIPLARDIFLRGFDASTREQIADHAAAVRASLHPEEAYLEIPGRDPAAGTTLLLR